MPQILHGLRETIYQLMETNTVHINTELQTVSRTTIIYVLAYWIFHVQSLNQTGTWIDCGENVLLRQLNNINSHVGNRWQFPLVCFHLQSNQMSKAGFLFWRTISLAAIHPSCSLKKITEARESKLRQRISELQSFEQQVRLAPAHRIAMTKSRLGTSRWAKFEPWHCVQSSEPWKPLRPDNKCCCVFELGSGCRATKCISMVQLWDL